jgi:hypothetical protein
MDIIVGERKFVDVPGSKTHELPPLLVRGGSGVKRPDKVMGMAKWLVETEDLLDESDENLARLAASHADLGMLMIDRERRRMDLAINLAEQYQAIASYWQWGDDVIEWIRQCETTFCYRLELRNLLQNQVWPHAGRSSFVRLLEDKEVYPKDIGLEKAVGLRLSFHQLPPIKFFANQFLFYLNSAWGNAAYQTWESMSKPPVSSLPPERFSFEVVDMSIE